MLDKAERKNGVRSYFQANFDFVCSIKMVAPLFSVIVENVHFLSAFDMMTRHPKNGTLDNKYSALSPLC